jgi:recombination protein RecA
MARNTETKKKGELESPEEKKSAALNACIMQIERECGKGAIMRLGEAKALEVVGVSTGSLTLDLALGIGGIPKGRITEIYGPESSGKTTIALHAIAEVQKAGGEAAFIDAEHALDPVYAAALGVDVDRLLVSQPDCGEQALEITEALARSGAVDIVVIDSVAALVPRTELEGNMGQSSVGVQARLMSQALRKLSGVVAKSGCTVIFINQLRQKIGVMYGNPEVTTGGVALKFFASVRIDIRRADAIKQGGDIIGNHTRCKVVKNKVSPPFKQAEFDILYGKGISKESEIVELATQLGILEKSGSWFSYDGQRLGQGKETIRKLLEEDKNLSNEIEAKIRAIMVNGDENHTAIEFANPQDDIFEKIDGEDDLGGMFD